MSEKVIISYLCLRVPITRRGDRLLVGRGRRYVRLILVEPSGEFESL